MIQFEGQWYKFDTSACSGLQPSLVKLPDGRFLHILTFMEVMPPIPDEFELYLGRPENFVEATLVS